MVIFDRVYSMTELATLLIALGLFVYAWGRRSTPTGRAAMGMMASLSIWLACGVISWTMAYESTQFFWEKMGYLGVLTLPVTWFLFALVLSGRTRWIKPYRVGLLLVVPALIFTQVLFGNFFSRVEFAVVEGVRVHQVEFSSWLYVSFAYTYGLMGIAIFLMVRSLYRSSNLYRYQVAILILAAIFPAVSNIIFLSRVVTTFYDLTPLTFSLSGFVLTYGLMRFSLFDLVLVARSSMVDRVSDGMIVLDAHGQVADLNQAAEQTLGVHLPRVVGHPLGEVVPALYGVLASDLANHVEISQEAGNRLAYYEVFLTPLYQQRNILAGHLLLLHDITARKQIESGLQAALARERELNEMKSRFYLYFSHQLRTPLSVIMSSAEMLEHYGRGWPEEKRQRHFQRIYDSVQRLLTQSREVTTIEMAEQNPLEVKVERFDPADFTHQLAEEVQNADQDRHVILHELQGANQVACLDVSMLRQVLENLLTNALKFSPRGTQVRFNLNISPQELAFTVQDQGCGIPSGDLPRVTQPFFRGSNVGSIPGTGLGLAIVQQFVQRMGGTLSLESREGEGTTATVVVPLEIPA